MISFFDKIIEKQNFKVWLYSPGGAFLGELIVDRPILNLQLEGFMSTFEFDIVENIEKAEPIVFNTDLQRNEVSQLTSVVNPRLNETLDQFQVEVWYGDLETDSFQKQRFIIIDTPNNFEDDITRFHYKAYSREYENKFLKVIDWPGVLIDEFTDIKTPNKNNLNTELTFPLARAPKNSELIRVEIVRDFVYRLPSLKANPTPLNFSVGAKQSTIEIYGFINNQWIKLDLGRDYQITVDDVTSDLVITYKFDGGSIIGAYNPSNEIAIYIDYKLEVPLIQALTRIDGAPRTSIFDFFYNPAQGTNGSITCFVPRIPQIFSKEGVQFYDNQIPEASNVVVNIYYEVNSSIPEELLNRTLTKDGLTIQQVLSSLFNNSGDEDNADAKWSARFH
jgi:hypothetical protein